MRFGNNLDKLNDITYLEKLSYLNAYWGDLQKEILIYRGDPYAVGYEYNGNSLQQMLEKADEKMYANKIALKAEKNVS